MKAPTFHRTGPLLLLSLGSPCALAAAVQDALVVTGSATEAAISTELANIAGATNLIRPGQEARLATLRDALDFQPGLVIQDFFGGLDQPRLNIRGSGIQSNPVNRGVLLLEDGLPLNAADGSFIIGTLEPRDSALIAVKRGGNAREPGATTLGGSLNFIPQTGTTGQNRVGIEAGSDGRHALYGAYNTAAEQQDFHISLSQDGYDGFRHHSASERTAVRTNLGLKLNDALTTRTYLSYTDLAFEIPFVVPKARAAQHPQWVMGDGTTPLDNALNAYKRDPRRDTQQLRLANVTDWQQSDSSHQRFGLYLQQTDDLFVDPLSHADSDNQTLGLNWRWGGLLGSTHYQLAASWDHSQMDRDYFANNPQNGSRLQQFGALDMEAENRNLSLLLQQPLTEQWQLDSQLRWSEACRNVTNTLNSQRADHCWDFVTASAGINYRPDSQQRWFANISTSHEAPTFWEIAAVSVSPANPAGASLALQDLEPQQAVTFEIGGEGQLSDALNWELALWRSKVSDELIANTDASGVKSTTHNYSDDTLHQGIELGLNGSQHNWHYRMAWTYSDFSFDGGSFEGNQIAGVPEHLISAELGYQLDQLNLSTNLRWVADDTAVDHANSLFQDDYAIWGLKVRYALRDQWQLFASVDNLFDETYTSSFVIRNQSAVGQPTFLPGNGRAFNAGVRFNF